MATTEAPPLVFDRVEKVGEGAAVTAPELDAGSFEAAVSVDASHDRNIGRELVGRQPSRTAGRDVGKTHWALGA
jgi:hypothetical protein